MIDFSKKPLFLAPLAGLSDPPMRFLAKEFGCDVTVSEMISANALCFRNQKTLNMLKHANFERPFIVQIEGGDESVIKKAVEIINEFDEIDGIDLNCGCPVPKVIKQSAGSALLGDLPKMSALIKTIKKYSNKRYTSVKMRLGFDEKIPKTLSVLAQDCGADFIVIHGRTRSGGYSAKVDYEAIAMAKDAVEIPVVANGDINCLNFGEVLEKTNADGLMIGRGSIGAPWVFDVIKGGQEPTLNQQKEIILRHFLMMRDEYKTRACALFRKHIHEYSRGFDGSSKFRSLVNHIDDESELIKAIDEFFS